MISKRSPRLNGALGLPWLLRIARTSTIPADSRPAAPGKLTSCHRLIGLTLTDPIRFPLVSKPMRLGHRRGPFRGTNGLGRCVHTSACGSLGLQRRISSSRTQSPGAR
jgi:hypothetical protein